MCVQSYACGLCGLNYTCKHGSHTDMHVQADLYTCRLVWVYRHSYTHKLPIIVHTHTHTQELLTGRDSWSMSELVHALAIMAHFHSLAGFALGCGVNPEIDTKFGHTWDKDGDTIPLHQLIYSNPALGIGNTPGQSDSDMTDSEPISPVTRSPVHPTLMTQSIIQHYIDSELLPLCVCVCVCV